MLLYKQENHNQQEEQLGQSSSTAQLQTLQHKSNKKDKYQFYQKDDISTKSHNDLFTCLNQQRIKVKGNEGRAKSRRERDEITLKSKQGDSNKRESNKKRKSTVGSKRQSIAIDHNKLRQNNTNMNINDNDTTKFNERDMASRISSTLNTEFIFDESHIKKEVRKIDKSQSRKDIAHQRDKSRRDSMSSTSKIGGFKSQMGKSQINDDPQDNGEEVFCDENTNNPRYKTNTTQVAHLKQRDDTLAIITQQSIKSDVIIKNESIDSKYQFKPAMNKRQQSQIKKRESVYQETVDEIKDSDEDITHQQKQLGRKKKSSVFKSQKSVDIQKFSTPQKLMSELPDKQNNTIIKKQSCQPGFATSGPCGLFARASIDKFGGLFKLQCKKVIDQGLDLNEDGFFMTNKNSAAQSKMGTRKPSEEDECDIHTSSDDAIKKKNSSMGRDKEDKNTEKLQQEYQKLRNTLNQLKDEKSNASIAVSPNQRSFFSKNQRTLKKLNPQFNNDDSRSEKGKKLIKQRNNISSQQSDFKSTLTKQSKRAHSRHQSEVNYNISSKQQRTELSKKMLSTAKSLKVSPTLRAGKSLLNIQKSKFNSRKNLVPGHEADADDISIKIIEQELIKNLQDESSIDLHESNNYSFSSEDNGNTSYRSQKIVNKSRRTHKKSRKGKKSHYSCSSCSESYDDDAFSGGKSNTKKSRYGDKSKKSNKAQKIKNKQYASPPQDRNQQFNPHNINMQPNFQGFNPFGFQQGYQTDQPLLGPNMNPFYNQYVNPNQLMAMQQQYMQMMYQQMQGFKNTQQVQQNNGNINETINQVFQLELVINPLQISLGNNNQNTYTLGQGNNGVPDLSQYQPQFNQQAQMQNKVMNNNLFQPQQVSSPVFQNALSQSSLGQSIIPIQSNDPLQTTNTKNVETLINTKLYNNQMFPQQSHKQSHQYDSSLRNSEAQEFTKSRQGNFSPNIQSKIEHSPSSIKNSNLMAGVYQQHQPETSNNLISVNMTSNTHEETIQKQTNQNYLNKLKNKFLSGMTGAARIAAADQQLKQGREATLQATSIDMTSPKLSRNSLNLQSLQVVTESTNNIQHNQQHQIEFPQRERISMYKSQNDQFLQNRSSSINEVFSSKGGFLKNDDPRQKMNSITPMREREYHLIDIPLQQQNNNGPYKHQQIERFDYKGNNSMLENIVKPKEKTHIYQNADQYRLKTQSSNINTNILQQQKNHPDQWQRSMQDYPTQFQRRVMQSTRLGSESNGKHDIQSKLKMLNMHLSQELQSPLLIKQNSEQQTTTTSIPMMSNQDQFKYTSISHTPLSEKDEEDNLLSPQSFRNEEVFSENDDRCQKQNQFNNTRLPKQQKGEVLVINFKSPTPLRLVDTMSNGTQQSKIVKNQIPTAQNITNALQKSRLTQQKEQNKLQMSQDQPLKQIPPLSVKTASEAMYKNSLLSPCAQSNTGEFNFEDNKPKKSKPIIKHARQDSKSNLPKQQQSAVVQKEQSSKQQDIFIEILDKPSRAKGTRIGGSLIPQVQTSLADMFDQKLKVVKDKFDTRVKQYNNNDNEDLLSNDNNKKELSVEPKKEKTQRTKEDILELRKQMMKSKVRVKKDNFVAENKQEGGDSKKKNLPPDLMQRLVTGQKAQVDLKEMKKINNKIYENLPEIKKKKDEEKKKEEYKQRQIQAKKYAESVDLKRKQHFQKKQTIQNKDDFNE